MKFKLAFLLLFLLAGPAVALGQAKYEREFRIRKSQFPSIALERPTPYLEGTRRVRFYQEVDSNLVSYEIKFRKIMLLEKLLH